MILLKPACWLVFLVATFAPVPATLAQTTAEQYEPSVGQDGKDVVWVPTAQGLVDRMLDMAQVTARDYVIDLGSGDGRTVITAAKRGARALGIEYNPDMVKLSRQNAEMAGVGEKAQFRKADLFETDFSDATVITMFLLPEINLKLRPKILDLAPGTRVVSNSFDMGEWVPDRSVTAEGDCSAYCRAFLWIVPAKVDGKWKLANGDLEIVQDFQTFSGTLQNGDGKTDIKGRLNGNEIAFDANGVRYTGRVNGDSMEGEANSGSRPVAWVARRGG